MILGKSALPYAAGYLARNAEYAATLDARPSTTQARSVRPSDCMNVVAASMYLTMSVSLRHRVPYQPSSTCVPSSVKCITNASTCAASLNLPPSSR